MLGMSFNALAELMFRLNTKYHRNGRETLFPELMAQKRALNHLDIDQAVSMEIPGPLLAHALLLDDERLEFIQKIETELGIPPRSRGAGRDEEIRYLSAIQVNRIPSREKLEAYNRALKKYIPRITKRLKTLAEDVLSSRGGEEEPLACHVDPPFPAVPLRVHHWGVSFHSRSERFPH